jgi:guanylate cyclase
MVIITLATMALGGLATSGFHILWAFVSVMVALVALSRRAAAFWFGVYALAVAITVAGGSWLDTGERPDSLTVDTIINVAGASLLIFMVMVYFVRQRELFQRQSDDLLHNILPASIAEKLKVESSVIADRYEMATVLFADVVGFTPMTAAMDADELVGLLDDIFTTLDTIAAEMGLEKIKTVGDEYMVAAGVPEVRADHAHAMAEFALAIRDIVAERDFGGHRIELRIGMHSGPVVAGIIGQAKFSYDLWGDTVNTASRLETFGVPGEIHISRTTRDLIADEFECERRGMVALKGKGETETWFLRGRTG